MDAPLDFKVLFVYLSKEKLFISQVPVLEDKYKCNELHPNF